jgi:small subunit ribosomal protein S7
MTIKIFGRWEIGDIKVADTGLVDFIGLKPVYVPRTGARYAKNRFHKSKTHIVERFMNKLMVSGHKGKKHRITSYPNTGKSMQVYGIVENMLKIIEQRTKSNPIAVLVKAVETAAPREEIVGIEYGGARYPKAVDCAPQRRVDVALRYMIQGAYSKSFNSKKKIEETLAEEVMNAAGSNSASNAIARKLEIERQADSSR